MTVDDEYSKKLFSKPIPEGILERTYKTPDPEPMMIRRTTEALDQDNADNYKLTLIADFALLAEQREAKLRQNNNH